jgi:hypothetical protein
MIVMTNAQCPCSDSCINVTRSINLLQLRRSISSTSQVITAAFIRYRNAKKDKYASAELVLFLISFTRRC